MHKILENVLKDNNYVQTENLEIFSNSYESFITQEYTIEEIADFFNCDKTNDLILRFKYVEDKVKRNTSLLLCVKVDNLKEIYNNYRNTIIRIEEDEYYFRKYVILYTDEGEEILNSIYKKTGIINYILYEDSKEKSMFEEFEKDMFFSDSYFIAIEIAIKLPFLNIPRANARYESIEERIEKVIEEHELGKNVERVNKLLKEVFAENMSRTDVLNKLIDDNKEIWDSLEEIMGE